MNASNSAAAPPADAADHYDVIVVGSGAGGMSAAITAALEGCSVLLLEKHHQVGGSTAISGGAIWAPLNDQSAAVGHPDTPAAVDAYLAATVSDKADPALLEAFIQAAPQALAMLSARAGLHLVGRSYSPDYYSDRPGAALGGRSLDPAAFDGRTLGRHFAQLRSPLPEFTVLGGMMITLTDARHLLAATRSWTAFKASLALLGRYATDRLRGYGRGTRLVLGNALAGQLFKAVLDLKIPYRCRTAAQALTQDESGRITGVIAATDGQAPKRYVARLGVVLACGGFPWHAGLREQHFPAPSGPYSMAPPQNTGDGIELALAHGADWGRNQGGPALWAPVSIGKRPDGSPLRYPHLVWDRAKPGLMAVNQAGQRFVNESTSYHEFVRGMYASPAPAVPAFLICDHDFIEQWGLGLALPGGRARQHWIDQGYLLRDDTLAGLAQQLNIPADALTTSAAQFDACAETGVDPDYGKGSTRYNQYLGDTTHRPNPCLGPLRRAPFYAVRVYPGDIGTALGLAGNRHGQVLDAQGRAIAGLYAAGNDLGSVMGGEYPGPGITLGPALTFGWLAARHLASQRQP